MRSLLLVVAAALLVAVSACSGGSSSSESPQQQLAQAKKSVDSADYIGFTITGSNLPEGTPVLKKASGTGTHAPAFTGTVDVDTGVDIQAQVVVVDGSVYAELPFAGWTTIDLQKYGAPDPARLMSTDHGISALLTRTTELSAGKPERHGHDVLTTIRGSLPASAVASLFPTAGRDGDFAVTYTVTEDDSLRAVSLTGAFYAGHGGDTTYRIKLDLAADPVTITAPK